MKRRFFIALVFCLSFELQAQPLPSTDIYHSLFNTTLKTVSGIFNTSHRIGYDNQPSFLNDSTVLFTSIREDEQADIYKYSLSSNTLTRITETVESEYSPTLMPDGKHFSVVRVEKDSTQRLWKFDLNGKNPELILKIIKPVGYHCWIDSNHVALFVLGEPVTLQLVDIQTERATILDTSIGRSLHKIPGREAFSYVKKWNDSTWFINEYDLTTKKSKPIIQTLAGSEDYVWTPTNEILMGRQSKLFHFSPNADSTWSEVADFSKDGIRDIKRLAVSPDGKRIAIVANDAEKK
jgi:hypothetical protein